MDESFRATPPPIHPDDLGPPPGSILLDVLGYFSSRTNATTAEGFTRTNKRIKVTFWAAHPPRASYFTVCSEGLELTTSVEPSVEAKIINTDDDLVLLQLPTCYPSGVPDLYCKDCDYFVYHAGTKNKGPSLERIPAPPFIHFFDCQVGLLRCRARDMYFVAILTWAALPEARDKYDLHLYSSDTETWSTKLMTCLDSRPKSLLYMYSDKVITIGGELGSVGWADLRRGILICDVLLDNRELRYIPLPSPAVPRPFWLPAGVACRDTIVLEGYLKYFEMCVSLNGGWEAVEWRRRDSWKNWQKHRVIKVSVGLEAETKDQPTLKAYSGFPALSLHDAGVVYIMDRDDFMDKEVLVIAVDMRNQTLKGVADYVQRIPLAFSIYCGSGISKHLRWTSSVV